MQLVFNTVGWFLTSLAWSQLRGQDVVWDPDFRGAINDGLLDSEFAATNLAVGTGAVSIGSVWAIIFFKTSTGCSKVNAQSFRK